MDGQISVEYAAIPRHSEIKDILVKKICKDLGVEPIK